MPANFALALALALALAFAPALALLCDYQKRIPSNSYT